MKHRQAVMTKLEHIDSSLSKLRLQLNQGNRDGCYDILKVIKEQADQIRTYVESESILNK